jgi:transketolase
MRNSFINEILAACREHDDIYIVSGDSGLGVFDRFRTEYPHRFINSGAAEQNAISFAAGLAMTGNKVFVYNIIPFLLYRCYEQVRNDICYQELPVVLVGTGSGITYAPQGMSHYSVEDLGVVQTLPNLVTISPIDPVEARAAARYALSCEKPLYVRIAKSGEPIIHPDEAIDITTPQVIRQGTGAAIVFHGSIAAEVLAAYETLAAKGRAPLLLSVPTLQPLDSVALSDRLATVNHVVCVEEHFTNCGLGKMLACLKAETAARWGLTLMGIPPHFIHEIRKTGGLRESFGMAAADLVSAVESALGA